MSESKNKSNDKHVAKIVRGLERDLRAMESIEWQAQWLSARDSNCSNAASMKDAIVVLIAEAIRLHKEEIEIWKKR